MQRRFRGVWLAGLLCALMVAGLAGSAAADVRLPGIIADNMVLQRGMRVGLWGWADSGENVMVEFNGQTASRVANADGYWRVTLRPMTAGGPFNMVVRGNNEIVVKNVAIGEVWIGSGQSNMAMAVNRAMNFEQEKTASDDPMLRHFTVGRSVNAEVQSDVTGSWQVAGPETVGGFSASAYFFARELRKQLGVPVGVINSSWGGSSAIAWMPRRDLAEDAELAPLLGDYKELLTLYPEASAEYSRAMQQWYKDVAEAKKAGEPEPKRPWVKGAVPTATATGMWNAMIAPLTGYTIRGCIWYQGEADAGRYNIYTKMMTALIEAWRREFRQPDMPFIWVQLANYEPGTLWPWQREAQTKTLALPNTGEACIIDVGMANDIHPVNKQAVGYRLALNALANVYGMRIEYSGPTYREMNVEGNTIRISFDHVGGGLEAAGGVVKGFVIADEDGQFEAAEAVIDGDAVVVSSSTVPNPVAVRYGWAANPEVTLYNAEGLPACPFRTDNWERVQ